MRKWNLQGLTVIEGEILYTPSYGDVRVLNISRERGGVIVGETLDANGRLAMGREVRVLVSACRVPQVFAGDRVCRGGSLIEWLVYSTDAEGKAGRCFRPGQPARYPTKSFGRMEDPDLHLLDYALQRWLCLDCGRATRNRTGLCPSCRKTASAHGEGLGERVRALLEERQV